MSFSFHGFPIRFAVYFIAATYLLMDLYACKGPLHVRLMTGRGASAHGQGGAYAAEVYGLPITQLELEEAMREQIWRRCENWETFGVEARKQTQWLALENLVNDRIIRAFRIMNGIDQVPPISRARLESVIQQRQFSNATEFPLRIAAQAQSQKGYEAAIYDDHLDQAWITEKIAHRIQEISSNEVRAWFDDFKETLRIPQIHHVAHVFLTQHDVSKPDRESEIREIHRQLLSKKQTFSQLATQYSDDERSKNIGGDLGWLNRDRMPVDFMVAVEQSPVGEFSHPLKTELGWHIIIVLERKNSRLPSFEESRDEISALLISQRREAAVKSLIAELRERSIKPTQFVFYHAQVIDRAEPAP